MERSARHLIVIAALIAAGCGGTSGIEGDADASHDPAREDAPDVDVPPDVAIPDAECDPAIRWTTVPRTIDSVVLVDGIARVGATQRLLVTVQLQSGCEELAGIDVEVDSGDATDFVNLGASAWVPLEVDCPPVAPLVERVISIPGRAQGNLHVVVTDLESPGGGLRLVYDRDACSGVPDCMCGPGTPAGTGTEWSDCMTDCSCAEGLSCIGYFGIAGPLWNCARICSDFRDCDAGETCLPPIPDGAPYVCSADGDECEDDSDCPPGFVCDHSEPASFCADARTGPLGTACGCDGDCLPGHRCVEPGSCEIPCLSDSWCPLAPIEDPVCTNLFVCAWPD